MLAMSLPICQIIVERSSLWGTDVGREQVMASKYLEIGCALISWEDEDVHTTLASQPLTVPLTPLRR